MELSFLQFFIDIAKTIGLMLLIMILIRGTMWMVLAPLQNLFD